MNLHALFFIYFTLVFNGYRGVNVHKNTDANESMAIQGKPLEIPEKNQLVVNTVKKYGPVISSTYEKAVCTELVIQILEKIIVLNSIDRKRIRIITDKNIQELLKNNSMIPKGVYYSLIEKGVGIPIDDQDEVCEGDFVQFWTATWGHCGIVKSINPAMNEMELYSSFPTTNGYGIQTFSIPLYSFFVRLK
jgi:hypothetical protein